MSNQIEKVVDITRLAEYINKIEDMASITKMMAPVYLRDFIVGQDVAATLLAKAVQTDNKAKAALEYAESIAYLENAKTYLDSKSIKDTSEARKQYVNIDPEVIKAKDNRAMTEAMIVLLKSRCSELRQAHDTLKKITYGDSNMTPFEGM
jgi:hypothetical protein